MSISSGVPRVALRLPLAQRPRSLLNLRLIATVHHSSPLFKNNSALIWNLPKRRLKFSSSTACSAHRRTDMRFSKKIALTVFIIALASIPLAQAQSSRPAFEFASIKRNTSGDRRSRVGDNGTRSNIDRFVARNASLRMLALYAYPQLRNDEVVGGPAWSDTDRFDVEAKPEHSNGPIPLDKIHLMLQLLLVKRFQLKTHFEMRELSIYNLVVAKDSPRIKLSEDQTVPPPPTSSPDGALQRGAANVAKDQQGLIVSGSAVPISTLVEMLQGPAET